MQQTLSVKEEMEGKLFISRQSRHISFVIIMIKVLLLTLYIYLACKQLCFPPKNGIKMGNENIKGDTHNTTLKIS